MTRAITIKDKGPCKNPGCTGSVIMVWDNTKPGAQGQSTCNVCGHVVSIICCPYVPQDIGPRK